MITSDQTRHQVSSTCCKQRMYATGQANKLQWACPQCLQAWRFSVRKDTGAGSISLTVTPQFLRNLDRHLVRGIFPNKTEEDRYILASNCCTVPIFAALDPDKELLELSCSGCRRTSNLNVNPLRKDTGGPITGIRLNSQWVRRSIQDYARRPSGGSRSAAGSVDPMLVRVIFPECELRSPTSRLTFGARYVTPITFVSSLLSID